MLEPGSFLVLLAILMATGISAFLIGYWTARPHFYGKYLRSHQALFKSNEELKRMPAGQALNLGFLKGYNAAIADTFVLLRTLKGDPHHPNTHDDAETSA